MRLDYIIHDDVATLELKTPNGSVLLTGAEVNEKFLIHPATPDDAIELSSYKKYLIDMRDWATFYLLEETVADLRSGYAMTTHSAQGSSFNNVFFVVDDFNAAKYQNKDTYCRLRYVGITRAINRLWYITED